MIDSEVTSIGVLNALLAATVVRASSHPGSGIQPLGALVVPLRESWVTGGCVDVRLSPVIRRAHLRR